jgi:hypothetical protein
VAAPSFIAESETAWGDSTSPETAAVTIQASDVMVLFCIVEATAVGINAPTGGTSVTWTARGSVTAGSFCRLQTYTAVPAGGQSFSVSMAETSATNNWWGYNVFIFRGSDGVGAVPAAATGTGSTPTVNITTTQANSAIVVANGDFSAVDGTTRTARTNAGAFTEQTYFRDSTHYAAYGGFHADAGSVGTYAVGWSAPAAQTWSVAAIEVKGSAGGAAPPVLVRRVTSRQAGIRASRW